MNLLAEEASHRSQLPYLYQLLEHKSCRLSLFLFLLLVLAHLLSRWSALVERLFSLSAGEECLPGLLRVLDADCSWEVSLLEWTESIALIL